MSKQYLTNNQVRELNEKHGWFEFGDAQSDISRAFAQDAIAMHECLKDAAPDLYEALHALVNEPTNAPDYLPSRLWDAARAALAKAEGKS